MLFDPLDSEKLTYDLAPHKGFERISNFSGQSILNQTMKNTKWHRNSLHPYCKNSDPHIVKGSLAASNLVWRWLHSLDGQKPPAAVDFLRTWLSRKRKETGKSIGSPPEQMASAFQTLESSSETWLVSSGLRPSRARHGLNGIHGLQYHWLPRIAALASLDESKAIQQLARAASAKV